MNKILILFALVVLVGVIGVMIPSAYANDFIFESKCIGENLIISVVSKDGGEIIKNINVYTTNGVRAGAQKFEKFSSDENGEVTIGFLKNTGFVNISKPGFNDQRVPVEICSQKQVSAPSSMSSQESKESFDASYPEIKSSKIIISGETNPIVKKGMISKFTYQVEIIGELEYDYSVNDKGGWLERCYDNLADTSGSSRCATSDKVFLISETSRVFEYDSDFSHYWDDQDLMIYYDSKPKVIQEMFRFNDELSSFNIYPVWQESKEVTLSQESIEKIHTRSISVKGILPSPMDERWMALLEICSGENSLLKPSIIIESDLETTYYVLPISVNKLSCTQQEVSVKAKTLSSINFKFETSEVVNDEEINQLKKEIEELKETMIEQQQLPKGEAVVDRVSEDKVVEEKVVATEEKGGGCLIATATYGTELAPQVQLLREIRDNSLLQTESGTVFMKTFNEFYYSFSPTIADYERENPVFKEAVKIAITPMISTLSQMENANSESEVLGIGISLIALNLGMYVGIPAVVIIGIRAKF